MRLSNAGSVHGAMRAGADSFIPLPAQSGEVMGRIAELLDADTTDPFRVLIVEDDRSQAIFAESILRKAGMRTLAATDPLAALDQLGEFNPELILMDLYMPNCSGMENHTGAERPYLLANSMAWKSNLVWSPVAR